MKVGGIRQLSPYLRIPLAELRVQIFAFQTESFGLFVPHRSCNFCSSVVHESSYPSSNTDALLLRTFSGIRCDQIDYGPGEVRHPEETLG